MIPLRSKPNVIAPGGNNIFGDIKDDTGSNNGTPINRQTHTDMHQFFESLMLVSGITPNGLVDNDPNGYQLIQALTTFIDSELVDSTWKNIGAGGNPAFKNSWVNAAGRPTAPARFRRENARTVLRISGVVSSGTSGSVVFTLAGVYVPTYTTMVALGEFGTAVARMQIQGVSDANPGDCTIFYTGPSVQIDLNCTIPLT
jgi:hypothetical protein